MNWDNQDKDPWGDKNDAPDFDDLIKKFSAFIGGKDSSSGKGSGTGSGNGGGMKIPTTRIFLYGFFCIFNNLWITVYLSARCF